MRAVLSWLREFAPLDRDPEALGEVLDDLGTPVEALERVGEGLDDLLVARVVDTRAHPRADRIQLVDVDAGNGEVAQVCCGAFNMASGDLVPLAPVGATLPDGLEITRRKMRGEWSNGMLCSPAELGLGRDHTGIMVLPGGLEPGERLVDALDLQPDVVFDLEVNPNRPDAMSMVGIARDLAAKLGEPFALPEPSVTTSGPPVGELASLEVLDKERCGRFTVAVLEDVAVGASVPRVANRLLLAGMRPINSLVDASNYVMLELGHPNHPYDLDRLGGAGLRVRRARPDEALVTLDGVERRFSGDELLICDARDAPIGIAGVMGGESTEIGERTTRVLLETAWFAPMPIARTARRLKLRTEASARFERGLDPEGLDRAAARFCELVAASSPGARVATGIADVRGELPERRRVRVRTARVEAVCGLGLGDDEIAALLEPIGFAAEKVADGELEVTVPGFRPDSADEIDVVEEVLRVHGYGRIEPVVPAHPQVGALDERQRIRRRVRDALNGLGVDEARTSVLVGPGDLDRARVDTATVGLANPMVAEESVLRTSLRPGLLRAIAYNASHRNHGVRLFEIGTVFAPPDPDAPAARHGEHLLPREREGVAVALAGAEAPAAKEVWDLLAGALDLGTVEVRASERAGLHATRSAAILVAGEEVGHLGEVDPDVLADHEIAERVAWVEVDLEGLLDAPREPKRYRPVSRYPSSDVDLAFVVDDDVPAARVEAALQRAGGDLLVGLRLFDVFRGAQVGEGRRSLAFSLRFQARDRTLTDEEVADARRRCIEAVTGELAAVLRGAG